MYTLQALLMIRKLRLSRYIILGGCRSHSPKKGAAHLLKRSAIAMTLMMEAISAVSMFMSARMNGVNIEKFASAKIAIDIPNMIFT
jgi:hypothetical protein